MNGWRDCLLLMVMMRMNRSRLHLIEGKEVPCGCTIMEAVPGVGNVGKLIVDGLLKEHPSEKLGWIVHPDFPPQSTLDQDGLIRPPRMDIWSLTLPNGETLLIITGLMQPLTASGQFEISEKILEIAAESESGRLLVLAGRASNLEERDIHIVCSDAEVRNNLEADGIAVSGKKPEGGMIGIAGLVISLAPEFEVPAIGIIADTIGTSSDVMAADRMANWIGESFGYNLGLGLDSTKETAKRLMESIDPSGSIDELLKGGEGEVSADFYV